MRAGIAMMPTGHRRTTLEQIVGRVIDVVIERRVLAFDQLAADEAAGLAASRRRQGRPGEFRDTMIAGIATARRASLATRNTRHFDDLPVPVVDPWAA